MKLKVEDLKKNETLYLKKEIVIYSTNTEDYIPNLSISLDVGTPVTLLKKEEYVCRFNVLGSFLNIKIRNEQLNNYFSDFMDNLDSKGV